MGLELVKVGLAVKGGFRGNAGLGLDIVGLTLVKVGLGLVTAGLESLGLDIVGLTLVKVGLGLVKAGLESLIGEGTDRALALSSGLACPATNSSNLPTRGGSAQQSRSRGLIREARGGAERF